MSIIVLVPDAQQPLRDQEQSSLLDPAVRALLDHIAAELAAEYVRLMEAAAEADASSPTNDADN